MNAPNRPIVTPDSLIVDALPSWADNPDGRAIIEAIIAERPDYFIRSGTWIEGGGVRRYQGKNAGSLRRLYKSRHIRLDDNARELFDRGEPWDIAAHELHAFLATEEPDALIERIVEGFSFLGLTARYRPDGRSEVAA